MRPAAQPLPFGADRDRWAHAVREAARLYDAERAELAGQLAAPSSERSAMQALLLIRERTRGGWLRWDIFGPHPAGVLREAGVFDPGQHLVGRWVCQMVWGRRPRLYIWTLGSPELPRPLPVGRTAQFAVTAFAALGPATSVLPAAVRTLTRRRVRRGVRGGLLPAAGRRVAFAHACQALSGTRRPWRHRNDRRRPFQGMQRCRLGSDARLRHIAPPSSPAAKTLNVLDSAGDHATLHNPGRLTRGGCAGLDFALSERYELTRAAAVMPQLVWGAAGLVPLATDDVEARELLLDHDQSLALLVDQAVEVERQEEAVESAIRDGRAPAPSASPALPEGLLSRALLDEVRLELEELGQGLRHAREVLGGADEGAQHARSGESDE